MKNEIKAIIIISGVLLLSLLTNAYLLKPTPTPDKSLYEELYNNSRETIGDLREYNKQAGEKLDTDRELQREYKELQLSADRITRERDSIRAERDQIKRERDEAIERIGRLVGVTEEIAGALGEELDRAFGNIEEGRAEIQRLGETIK